MKAERKVERKVGRVGRKASRRVGRKLKKGSRTWRELIAAKIRKANLLSNRYPCKCKRCGYRWKAKVRVPGFCSRCKSRAWNKSRREAPPRRSRLRFWLDGVQPYKFGPESKKGAMVVRRVGMRELTERQWKKAKRDAQVKRARRAERKTNREDRAEQTDRTA
jgi:predicted Zn-ribbon and HTH transcriptional regulator